MTPLVSITMSTYNVKDFISESLDSITNQTLKEIEIICIDDGSTDGTVDILQDFAQKEERIQLVLKETNEGLAVARNKALELARGKYITFLDGDDLYDLEMIEKAYKLAEINQSDMVIWDYHVFYNPSELKEVSLIESNLKDFDVSDKIALLQRPSFTWVKLLRTEKAKELGIHFPEGRTRQDIPVHWHLVTALDKISILPERLVYYRQQPAATTSQKDRRIFDLAYVMDTAKSYLETQNLYNSYKNEFLRQRLNLLFGMLDSVKDEFKNEALELINVRLSKDEWQYIQSKEPLRIQARWFYKSKGGDFISLIKYQLWKLVRLLYRKIN